MFSLSDILLTGCTVLGAVLNILVANFDRGSAVGGKYLFSIVYIFWYERYISYYLEINVYSFYCICTALLLQFVYLQINRTLPHCYFCLAPKAFCARPAHLDMMEHPQFPAAWAQHKRRTTRSICHLTSRKYPSEDSRCNSYKHHEEKHVVAALCVDFDTYELPASSGITLFIAWTLDRSRLAVGRGD